MEESLAEHLTRIEHYMRGCELLDFPRQASALRAELAAFIRTHATDVVQEWVGLIAPTFPLPPERVLSVTRDMRAALLRWAQHIEDPQDTQTYEYLREHAWQGFISLFPASRFLASQMKIRLLLVARLRHAYAKNRKRLVALLTLLDQEFSERLLHITDFFVEAREEALRDEEERHRKAVDHAPAPIFQISGRDGAIQQANREAEKATGMSRAELAGRAIWDLHPPEEKAHVRRLYDETLKRGYLGWKDLRLVTKKGEDATPVSVYFGVIEHHGEKTIQGIYVDISDRRQLESQLIQSEKMAAIGQLAAGIAHEIRNPLGIILNALYDLDQSADATNPDMQEDLHIARGEIARAQEIISNLLEFSREGGTDMEEVDLDDLLGKTLQLMRKYLETHRIRVMAGFGDVGHCLANQNALRQVFLNLITNAVQAMPQGGELRVQTRRTPHNYVSVEVSDTGVGIPAHQLNSIFNPFFTTKAPGQGTGLGLSIVHSVIKRYQGRIAVHSDVHQGTTFFIELPCPRAEDAPAPETPSTPRPGVS